MSRSRRNFRCLLFTCFLVFGFGPDAYAGFIGLTLEYRWFYPTIGSTYDGPVTAVVGAGTEFTPFGTVPVDVSDNTILFDWNPGQSGAQFTPATFNGATFFDILGTIDAVTGVSINPVSNLAGFDSSRIFFDADTIRINFQSLVLGPGDTNLLLDVTFAETTAVPEPSSLTLVSLSMAALFRAARKRRPE